MSESSSTPPPKKLLRYVSASSDSLIIAITIPAKSSKTSVLMSGKSAKRKRSGGEVNYVESEGEAASTPQSKRRVTSPRVAKHPPTLETPHGTVDEAELDLSLTNQMSTRSLTLLRKKIAQKSPPKKGPVPQDSVYIDPISASFELVHGLRVVLNPYAGPLGLDLTKLDGAVLELLRSCSSEVITQQQERDMASLQKLVAEQGADVWAEVTSLQMQCRDQYEEQQTHHEQIELRYRKDMDALMKELASMKRLLYQRDFPNSITHGSQAITGNAHTAEPSRIREELTISESPKMANSSLSPLNYRWSWSRKVAPSTAVAIPEQSTDELQRSEVALIQPRRHNSVLKSAVTAALDIFKNAGSYMFATASDNGGKLARENDIASQTSDDVSDHTETNEPLELPTPPPENGYMLRSKDAKKDYKRGNSREETFG